MLYESIALPTELARQKAIETMTGKEFDSSNKGAGTRDGHPPAFWLGKWRLIGWQRTAVVWKRVAGITGWPSGVTSNFAAHFARKTGSRPNVASKSCANRSATSESAKTRSNRSRKWRNVGWRLVHHCFAQASSASALIRKRSLILRICSAVKLRAPFKIL